MRTYTRINEDYLDDSVIDTEDISLHDDIRSEIDRWIEDRTPLSFDLNRLGSAFYPVSNEDELLKIIDLCMSLYGNECNLNWIDVSKVKVMAFLFNYSTFNGDISKWNVSGVTDMRAMFQRASFNGDLSKWDVSNVQHMQFMFSGADKFNQDLSKWNVSSVKNMSTMFRKSAIDCDLSGWDVSNVRCHDFMFSKCPLEKRLDRQPKFKVK